MLKVASYNSSVNLYLHPFKRLWVLKKAPSHDKHYKLSHFVWKDTLKSTYVIPIVTELREIDDCLCYYLTIVSYDTIPI